MKNLITLVGAAVFIFASAFTLGQDTPIDLPCQADPNRPCIGLVLGGGGARGGAHVGVLQTLETLGVPIDLVVGTSIGAFVGGLYASGKSPEDISTIFSEADWDRGYQDDLGRSNMQNRRKRQLDSFPIRTDLGLDTDGFSLPRGFIQGQGLKSLIDNMLGYFPSFTSFDELPIPFRAVAADIETGEAVVLADGDLATALQTSMSLPGIVRPMNRNGRLLVDGGIANNLPVDVARALGAEIIIAVDIGSEEATQEELGSSLAILRQLTSLMTRNNAAYQKSLLTDRDILIVPAMTNVTLLSFDRIDEAHDAGITATQQAFADSASLRQLASYGSNAHELTQPSSEQVAINEITLRNNSRLADSYLLSRFGIQLGQPYTPQEIQAGVDRLYGQGTIARVNANTIETNQGNILALDVDEKEWGPGYLDMKFGLEDDYNTFSRYQLGISYRYTNLSPYGAEWYTTAEIGTRKKVTSEIYWPFGNSDFFAEGSVGYSKEEYPYLVDEESFGEITANLVTTLAGIGWNITDRFEVLLGNRNTDGRIKVPQILAAASGINNISFEQTEALFRVNYDSLDNAAFPRRGWRLLAEFSRSRDRFLDIEDFSTRVDAEINGVVSLGRHSLRGNLRYQRFLNEDPLSLIGNFQLGGFLNLSGYSRDQLSGQHARFASAVYTYELAANNFGALRLPLYLGVSLEAGNVWNDPDDVSYEDLVNAGSLFLGWNSPIGPTYLGYGENDQNKNGLLYLYLGISF